MTELGDAFDLELHPSRRLLLLLIVAHVLAMLALFRAELHPLLLVSLALAVMLHGYHVYRRHFALTDPESVAALRWRTDRWWLRFASGEWRIAEPVGDAVVTASLVLMRMRLTDRTTRVPVLILADSGDPDQIRRLRVRLRFARGDQPP